MSAAPVRLPAPGTSLAGRGVVITGGNRGIGLGLAQGCALAGARVAIWGRDEAALESATGVLRGLGGEAEIVGIRCDVADQAAVVRAFAETVDRLGTVHSVFANAGVSCTFRPFHEQTDDEWRSVMSVNVDGLRWTLREAIVHMLQHREGGALVGVASMAARFGMRNYAPYATSKAAVVALMKSIAVEYARKGIRSNSVLPGFVATEMTEGGNESFYEKITARTPVQRFGSPNDFARLAAFLADPELSYHTADTVFVDGGYMNV
ncbi:SDR family oxidoreductase [Nakamurella sp. YIM 132087]|uniref:SDR family oxidoreductase n=1 Tax=Nakamurella alba TaxID=2665158 RepID=A0A7K1FRS7_9ACTN|nr:SDR family NAD(P)-dependent oxidoreductase [Nakamurella alba]MTD15943.1 SDR family oxidoreductase [Nakamurella alba]